MLFLPFVLASFFGRGARFFLVAGLLAWGGERFESKLRQFIRNRRKTSNKNSPKTPVFEPLLR
jgi:hypothetical protein